MTNICAICHLEQGKREHQPPWDCSLAKTKRILVLEAEVAALKDKLRDAQDTTMRINEAWREERARWAGLDPARGLDTQGLTGPDDE